MPLRCTPPPLLAGGGRDGCGPPSPKLGGAAANVPQEILFGPRVQLPDPTMGAGPDGPFDPTRSARSSDEGQVDDISAQVTRMDIDADASPPSMGEFGADPIPHATEERDGGDDDIDDDIDFSAGDGQAFCNSVFRPAAAPLLPRPPSPPPRTDSRSGRARRTMASTRSSLRLANRPSRVPVAKRAQHRLMRELDFVNSQSPAADAVVNAYIDQFADSLPEQAVMALRAATRLGDRRLNKTLAAIVQGSEMVDMEVA